MGQESCRKTDVQPLGLPIWKRSTNMSRNLQSWAQSPSRYEAARLRQGSFLPATMEEPIKPGTEQGPESPDFNADLAHILSLLLTHDEITPDALNSQVERFIATYEPYRNNEAWIAQKSKVFMTSYLVSVLVDRFELLWPKNFLQLLLMCASICTYIHAISS